MDNKNITIQLSGSQRNLLLTYENEFADTDLLRLFAVAVKKEDRFEITLTEEQLQDVCDQMASCANAEKDPKKQSQLDDLCDHLEEYSYEMDIEDDTPMPPSCSTNTGAVYLFKVALEGNGKIWRTIAIRGGQTLDDLHAVIFEAFDREDEHLYSFYLPHSPLKKRPRRIYDQSTEYTHPYAIEEGETYGAEKQNAAMTTIDSLNLSVGRMLYYLFDFGDEWWHDIAVEKTDGAADNGKYPRVIERKGKSPEQYPDPEDDDA